MRLVSVFRTAALLLVLPLWLGTAPGPTPADPSALVGTWTVDLRPMPDAEGYTQPFTVTAVHDDGTFEAQFYGSPVQVARYNADWDVLHVAFVTTDGSTRYLHAARLEDGQLRGTTHAVERGFLSVWTAERSSN
ncbi:MAG: hypothetical protein AAGG50_21960 [Bacteroidota bacterium]